MSGKDRYDWSNIDPYLKENYEKENAKSIALKFNMKPTQIRDRAKHLGINKQPKFNWTNLKKLYVKTYYKKLGARPIADKFNISIGAVHKMAQSLDVQYLPKDEYICSQGYKMVGKSHNRKAEHRLVMEQLLGRKLSSNEIVHHKDEDKTNNEPNNLALTTRKGHIEIHRQELLKAKQDKL